MADNAQAIRSTSEAPTRVTQSSLASRRFDTIMIGKQPAPSVAPSTIDWSLTGNQLMDAFERGGYLAVRHLCQRPFGMELPRHLGCASWPATPTV